MEMEATLIALVAVIAIKAVIVASLNRGTAVHSGWKVLESFFFLRRSVICLVSSVTLYDLDDFASFTAKNQFSVVASS